MPTEPNPLKGKTYSITVQGCRTNLYEGEALAAALEQAGAVRCDERPDIAVVVTCTITAVADRKCRKLVRRLRRDHPGAVIAACGCYVQRVTDEERSGLGIDIILGNRLKHLLPQALASWFADGGRKGFTLLDDKLLTDEAWDGLSLDRPRLHSRAFLKVQDGCSHYCSYCIVPFVRGRPVSRDLDESVEEARRIVASGCPEIVLTGIHLGLYEKLAELVRRIGAIDGLKRLRFGSVEPFAVDKELLDALAETPAFCRHLHLPLQSGDDGVLAKMRRGYDSAGFARIVDSIRDRLGDDTHISTDLMVGFPGEDDEAFANSLKFVRQMRFGKLHVFPYSPREGTDAAKMQRPPEPVVKERVREALSAAEELHESYCRSWLGKEVQVLVEESDNGVVRGLARHYVRVAAEASASVDEEISVQPDGYADGILTCGKAAGEGKNFVDVI
jgi:threonylcarbamoyladenosine tRNA methylthiotransferase MtaB